MRGLTLLVATDDHVRFRAALSLACAQSALGGRVRVFCQETAVSLLVDRPDPDRATLAAQGLPDLGQLVAAAGEMGVALMACQTGLSAASLSTQCLYATVEPSGLVGVLATLDDDRLVVA